MFKLSLRKSYHIGLAVSLGFVALAIMLGGLSSQSSAEKLAALPVSTTDLSPTASGKPVAGPPARLSVVDLRTLPPGVSSQGKARPLPFRLPHGLDALAPVQSGLSKPASNAGIANSLDPQILVTAPPSITVSFRGISSTESGCGCVPPDGDMAVGPNHIILGVNTAFRVFNKTGTPLTSVVDFDSFFGSCGAAGLGSSDPITAYDPVADRFTVGILRYDGTTDKSFVSLAVSTSPDPTTTWNKYCFEQPYLGQDALYDFPHIGVGPDAIYTTGNLYLVVNPANNVSARVNAYDKAAMYSGAITATQVYSDVLFNSDMSPADTIRPALFNSGLPPGPTYFINVGSSQVPGGAPSHRATLWRWTAPFGANNFVQAGGQDLAPYLQAVPMLQPPPGPPIPPPGFIDVRLLGAAWSNGTIYGTHTIGCDLNGTTTDCVQWFQLGNINAAPTLIQQGIVSGTPTESRAYPNMGVDINGNVRLAYAFSSNTEFLGLRHTGRLASDPLGTMGTEGIIKAGEQAEILDDALRWGDYSGEVTDPDGLRIWHFEEYSQSGQSWGTWASAAQFPLQGTPTATVTGTQPTATRTSTALAASATTTLIATTTNTAVLPTATLTAIPPTQTPGGATATLAPTQTVVPTGTNTVVVPSATSTIIVPTGTATRTVTAVQPSTTATGTSIIPTVTLVPTGTNTVVATGTRTSTVVVPTATRTSSVVVPTGTNTVVVPTITGTPVAPSQTPVQPTSTLVATSTNTVAVPSATLTTVVANTATATRTTTTATTAPTQTPGGPSATTEPSQTPVPPSSTGTATTISTSVPSATSTPCTITFTDVQPDNVFYPFIRCLACRGIVSGYSDGTFRPFNDITRGQIAKIVSNAAGFDEDPGPQIYEDVDGNNPFYQWINRLSMRGHMGGYPCGTIDVEPCIQPDNRPYFRPFSNATRGQLAKIVSNAAGINTTPSGIFYTDVQEDNPFYVWIMRLTELGVMSGYECGGPGEPCDNENRPYFRPFNNVTRGQASKIVANTFFPGCETPVHP
jgi:hypothetical protein